MATKLRPCAFCGSKRVEVHDFGSTFAGLCLSCHAHGPTAGYEDIAETRGASGERLRKDAARRWNTRSIASAEATIREANGEATP